jgi:hypothetical protein
VVAHSSFDRLLRAISYYLVFSVLQFDCGKGTEKWRWNLSHSMVGTICNETNWPNESKISFRIQLIFVLVATIIMIIHYFKKLCDSGKPVKCFCCCCCFCTKWSENEVGKKNLPTNPIHFLIVIIRQFIAYSCVGLFSALEIVLSFIHYISLIG